MLEGKEILGANEQIDKKKNGLGGGNVGNTYRKKEEAEGSGEIGIGEKERNDKSGDDGIGQENMKPKDDTGDGSQKRGFSDEEEERKTPSSRKRRKGIEKGNEKGDGDVEVIEADELASQAHSKGHTSILQDKQGNLPKSDEIHHHKSVLAENYTLLTRTGLLAAIEIGMDTQDLRPLIENTISSVWETEKEFLGKGLKNCRTFLLYCVSEMESLGILTLAPGKTISDVESEAKRFGLLSDPALTSSATPGVVCKSRVIS